MASLTSVLSRAARISTTARVVIDTVSSRSLRVQEVGSYERWPLYCFSKLHNVLDGLWVLTSILREDSSKVRAVGRPPAATLEDFRA